jgi:diguanylate cyclase (GGDEF)-like protein/PAS domain S-box-containing protein
LEQTTTAAEFYENAPCGLILTTADDIVTMVNATFLEWSGFARDEVVGSDFHSLLDTGSQAFYATSFQADLWARGSMSEVAFRLLRADGTPAPILLNASLAPAPEGERGAVRLAVFDSTVRHDYEREMLSAKRLAERSESSIRVLQEASALFLAASTEQELAAAVATSAREAFDAFDSAVVMYGDDGRLIVVEGEHLEPTLVGLSGALPTKVAELASSRAVAVTSLDEAYRLSTRAGDLLRSVRAEAYSAIAIVDGETILGAVVCLFGRPRTLDEHQMALYRALARQAGLVLARIRLQRELENLARHDHLTGLANRSVLEDRLSHVLAVSRRSGTPTALIFVDLDDFKRINDELGHGMGDYVLKTVAGRIGCAVRDVDTVARFGGDEFVVLLESADQSAALAVAERITEQIRRPIVDLPADFAVTASAGVAVYLPQSSSDESGDLLVQRADAAMYEAKRAGADRITLAVVEAPAA